MIKYFAFISFLFFLTAPAHAEPLHFETTAGQTIPFDVEIANTPETRKQGLMNRDSLKPRTGMLFVFDKPGKHAFWMKDTKIRLDLVYIDENGIVKGIWENAIPFNTTPIYAPVQALAVLEISGGTAKTLGISKGDKVIHSIFEKSAK